MTNKIYIIEGQDRCGKSSMVNALRSKIKNPALITLHSTKPPKDVDANEWTVEYYNNLFKVTYSLFLQGFDVILDRSWLGEFVYGPLYRYEEGFTFTEKDLLGVDLSELPNEILDNIHLLVFVDDAASIAQRSDGESMSDDLYMLEQERTAFKKAFELTKIKNKQIFDWHYDIFSADNINTIADILTLNVNLIQNGNSTVH